MKKYIEIPLEVLERLVEGKCVEGSLRRDEWTGKITFRAYNRQPCDRNRDRMIRKLEHGWVKESKERIKLFESVPKRLGLLRVLHIIDRDTSEAKDAVMEWDMIESM